MPLIKRYVTERLRAMRRDEDDTPAIHTVAPGYVLAAMKLATALAWLPSNGSQQCHANSGSYPLRMRLTRRNHTDSINVRFGRDPATDLSWPHPACLHSHSTKQSPVHFR